MKKPAIQDIVFRRCLPHRKENDPPSFFEYIQRNIVPEVRLEVQTFYGSLDCLEAQYPGLDYTHSPHRRRLARYPWHRRLFRVFDDLRLTREEILSICQWEGTRSAKERYQVESKKEIRDTTADDVLPAPETSGPRARHYMWNSPQGHTYPEAFAQIGSLSLAADAADEESDEDEIATSIGVQLNQHLQAAVEARSRGDQVSVDAQWEQWMKEALERDELGRDSIVQAIRAGHTFPPSTTNTSRHNTRLAADTATISSRISEGPAPASSAQRYDDLRGMLHDLQSANNQLAADNAALAMLLSRSHPETSRSSLRELLAHDD